MDEVETAEKSIEEAKEAAKQIEERISYLKQQTARRVADLDRISIDRLS